MKRAEIGPITISIQKCMLLEREMVLTSNLTKYEILRRWYILQISWNVRKWFTYWIFSKSFNWGHFGRLIPLKNFILGTGELRGRAIVVVVRRTNDEQQGPKFSITHMQNVTCENLHWNKHVFQIVLRKTRRQEVKEPNIFCFPYIFPSPFFIFLPTWFPYCRYLLYICRHLLSEYVFTLFTWCHIVVIDRP